MGVLRFATAKAEPSAPRTLSDKTGASGAWSGIEETNGFVFHVIIDAAAAPGTRSLSGGNATEVEPCDKVAVEFVAGRDASVILNVVVAISTEPFPDAESRTFASAFKLP
jgi:hypothetical protein